LGKIFITEINIQTYDTFLFTDKFLTFGYLTVKYQNVFTITIQM